MSTIQFNKTLGIGVISGDSSAATFAFASTGKAFATDEKKASNLNERIPASTPYVWWGDNNSWPTDAIKTIEGNDLLSRIMADRAAIHFGKGLQTYSETIDNTGKRQIELVQDPEISDWLEENSVNSLYLPPTVSDYERFKIIFPQLVLSANRKKIARIFHQPTSSIRWEQQDRQTLLTRNVYLCHYWQDGPGESEWKKIPALDPYYPFDDIADRSGEYSFIFPCSLPSGSNRYYPMPCWYSAVKMGWVEISNSVPIIKKSIYNNSISIKYHIQVPYSYWSKKYSTWGDKTESEQIELMTNEMKSLFDVLQGKEKAGKAFVSGYGFDPETEKEYPGIKIDLITDPFKDGAYIPDSQEAAGHILWAGGLDPSIVGVAAPGGKMGAGSGSDKRESYWIHTAKLGIDHQITLSPFYFISRFNGWSKRIPGLKWGYIMEDTSPTLDKNPTGKQNTIG